MTQSFTLREPVSDLGQGVLTGANMVPPWNQGAAYNLLPNDGVLLEKPGQKRRRDIELTRGLMPNERVPSDPVQHSGYSVPSMTGGNNFCDLGAAQAAFANERQGFYSRMIQSASSGIFPLTRTGATYEPVVDQRSLNAPGINAAALYRIHRPAARSLDSAAAAAAATAQAMANFQALIDQGRSSGFQGPDGSASFEQHNGFEDRSSASLGFGGFHTNGHMQRSAVNVNSEIGNWPNLSCQTSVGNGSIFESNSLGSLAEPQSPCTPRGQQRFNTVLSASQQEYLQHMERINSIATSESPRYNSRGRDLFRDSFEAAPASSFHADKHVHIYLDSEIPKQVDDWTSATLGDEPPGAETAEFSFEALEDAERERCSQSFEPVPDMAPAESNIQIGEKDITGGVSNVFDLNEVPAGVGEAATPKPRKKYHPRVAKDKRTYKRRVDGKKSPAPPVDGFTNMNSPVKKAGKRSSNQTQYESTNDDGRDTSHPEVVDMDIEYNGYAHTTSLHNTAVCDCEACIKIRLERRMAQSPVSPPEHHSRGTWGNNIQYQSTPPRDSSTNSPPVRRNLFQPLAEVAELDQGNGAAARRSLGCFDTTSDAQQQNALVIPQRDAAYTAVKSFFDAQTTTSCLQQVNESAAQLGLIGRRMNLLSQQINSASAIVTANPTSYVERNPSSSHNHRVPAAHTNNSFMSRLCPRGILSPQRVPFRNMNAIQRVVYLKSLLSSSNQLQMSPESLLRHVYDHLPEDEKVEFKESIWPIVLSTLSDEQMKQLKEYADSDQVGASAVVEVVKRRGPKPKKPSKKELALTLWPDSEAMKSSSKAGKEKGRKRIDSAGSGIISQNGLEMVPYENKSMVPYDGPFNPLRKKKNRPKVVLDNETVRVWKLLMGKTGSEASETDAEKELKWEEERRKMKALALNFIDRMHTVQGDRSFSKWKGSVVDSVVGAFLTQNVNDVLSSSAFMSMRSRFPGRGFRKTDQAAPEEAVAQSFESELGQHPSPSAPSLSIQAQPQSSGIQEALSSCKLQTTEDIAAAQSNSECIPLSVTALESQESRNEESYDILHMEAASTQEEVLDPSCQKEDSKTSNSVLTEELSSGANNGVNQAVVVSLGNDITRDLTTESELVDGINQPSHGKYNPKTGLTGLERAQIEEKQVTARKSFDFSGLQEEFQPRVLGQERSAAPSRTEATEDGVDWEAVRSANVAEVADVIKERGLNWILAGRIKAFLERLHLDYGTLDLEWLRSMSTDQTKEFLLSVRGLGLKSVECIRLLTLHHLAFPVDTNVGRICVRLGWVPLEPLPEELQLHLLELYPVQATIQKYLWPRLCKLDHETLYELHYQMISFGKVFCTKSKPNCNACPMRPECKHFASALSSAKLALPASERPNNGPTLALPPGTSNPGENIPENSHLEAARPVSQYNCQPIVEEPMTPESEADIEELDIEDYPFSVQELIEDETNMNICIQDQPSTETAAVKIVYQQSESAHISHCCSSSMNVTIPDTDPVSEPVSGLISEPVKESTIMEDWGGLAAATSTSNVNQGFFPSNVIKIVDSTYDLDEGSNAIDNPTVTESVLASNVASSQEMVVVAPGAASLPVPKLKNVGRLRTVHYVYELPDNHPLLDGLDPREGDDPCTYLLAIWSPGEVPESIPNINDSINEENGPFASSSSEGEESIKATLLVPCRTAMRGSFPLNGTYFQVNEVFADHASSLQPMLVPRTLLWNLRRRFVFFGTTVTSIFRGMTAAEIQACFWRGYVCVRGFDQSTRAPKPLVGRLHLQAAKASGKGANVDV